jgi:sucrose-phosphate synthase
MNSNERSFLRLFVSDIDGTLLVDDELVPGQRGDEMALAHLKQELEANPGIGFGVASGRSLALVLSVLERYPNLPRPAFIISDVGSEIYWHEGDSVYVKDCSFHHYITQNWDRSRVVTVLNRFTFLNFQEIDKQRPTKVSFYTGTGFDLALVKKALLDAGPCTLVFSHGTLLDVLPERASKSQAIRFISETLGIAPENIVTAGDSGNDRDMLTAFKGIVVSNHAPELDELRNHPEVFFASGQNAAGVSEGLRHYGFLPSV